MSKLLQGSYLQGFARTEKWSHDESAANTKDPFSAKAKKVNFSKCSTQRVYVTDPCYENWKSYSSADQKNFRKQAVDDAFRINHLLSTFPGPTGIAVHELMNQGVLSREDLLGIEHLVGVNAKKAMQERRSYTNFVLGTQKHMRENNKNKINDGMLAAVAVAKSSRMIEKARLRAALAL